MDFTTVPIAIAETMKKAGCPLSEQQMDVLSGAVGLYLWKIEEHGLESLIQTLKKRAT